MTSQVIPTTQRPGAVKFSIHWLWLLVPLFLIGAMLWFVIFQPIQVLPRMQLAPGFVMVTQTGETITSEDLRGQLTLVNFTYSHCEAPECAQTTDSMPTVWAAVEGGLLGDQPVTFLTISLDPARDTPEVLADFAAQYNAPLPNPDALNNWYFATNPRDTSLKAIVGGGYRIWYEIDEESRTPNGDYVVDFRARYILVDGWGIVRAEYTGSTLDSERLLRDLALLNQEIERSSGTMRLAYEAAHLFRCYP